MSNNKIENDEINIKSRSIQFESGFW